MRDKTDTNKERMNGKIIMAINIIKDQNKLAPYVYSGDIRVSEDDLARWMNVSKEKAEQVVSLCYRLALEVLEWAVIQEQKQNLLSIEQAKKYLIEKIEEKVRYAQKHYRFPYDVIKCAMPINLIDEEKGFSEDNIENDTILNKMAYHVCESIKIIKEKRG